MSVTTAVHDGESRGQRSGPYVSRHAAPTPLARWAVLVGDLTRRPRRPGRFRLVGHRPLWAALTLLVVLSLRLGNSVRADEALTLVTGAWLRRSWTSGEDVYSHPETFLGGIPSLHPALLSAAESVAGLPGARAVSLVAMAIATVAVFVIADALLDSGTGWRPGTMAALLFATSGPVLVMSRLAIHQSAGLALALVGFALALRGVPGAARWPGPVATAAAALAGLVLGTAILVSHPSVLIVAVVLVIVGQRSLGPGSGRWPRTRAGVLVGCVLLPLVLWSAAAGTGWLTGARVALTQVDLSSEWGARLVETVGWASVPLGLALLALIVVDDHHRPLVRVLATGSVLLAVRQLAAGADPAAYLGGAVALAVLPGGYLLARLVTVRLGWAILAVLGYAALAAGMTQSQSVFQTWPDSTPLVRQVSYSVDAMPWIRMVAECPEIVHYGLWGRVEPWQVQGTYPGSFSYRGQTGIEALRMALRDNYVQLVVFDGSTEAGRVIDPTVYGFRLTDTVAQSGSGRVWRIYQRFDAVPPS